MRVLVFDPFHGAAGDMILGALLDCGADRKSVLRAMEAVVAEPVDHRGYQGRYPCREGEYPCRFHPSYLRRGYEPAR